MDEDDIWSIHMQTGEQLVWRGVASQRLRDVHRRRTIVRNSVLTIAAISMAAVFGWRFYVAAFATTQQSGLTNAVTLPLYAAFGLALLFAAYGLLRRMTTPTNGADYYAATNQRLLAADANGHLVQEIDGAAIAGIVVDGGHPPTSLQVLRRNDVGTAHAFSMNFIDELPFVANKLREIFPEATS
ncbi:MAG: hypothetical protein GC155_10770 [Alphaproteobacteria bacterium]|nr:hypothetical protein [Alphaproteobacteria bacterium]